MITATDRRGNEYIVDEVVQLVDSPEFEPPNWMNRKLRITSIETNDHCESGFNVQLKDVVTGHAMKRPIDTNWIQKLKNAPV